MLIIKYSVKTTAKPEVIWELWSKIETWPIWDNGIVDGKVKGDFVTGTKGWLKPKGGPKVNFDLIEVRENKCFHNRLYLPFTQLDFIHTLEYEQKYTIVTHQVEMKGILTFLFSKIMGATIKTETRHAVEKLVKIAESR